MTPDDMGDQQHRVPREWIAAALRGDAFQVEIDAVEVADLVAVAEYEHVLPMLEWQLRQSGNWQALPDAFRKALGEGARSAAMHSMFRASEQQRISKAFAQAGARALLLKGNAIALWLYPQPHLRTTSDIDLLVASRDDAHHASQALTDLGYDVAFTPGSMNFEMTSRLTTQGINRFEVDLHWRLVNSVLFADIFSFEELWESSFPLAGIEDSTRALSPDHALVNACMNRALDMQNGEPDRMKLVYDIHLMLSRMDAGAQSDFVELTSAKGLSGVCLRSIEDSVSIFATERVAGLIDALRMHADHERIDYRRLQDWRYMQWQCFKAMPTLPARMRWLWERMLPPRTQLQSLHGQDASLPKLLVRRIKRGFLRLRHRSRS